MLISRERNSRALAATRHEHIAILTVLEEVNEELDFLLADAMSEADMAEYQACLAEIVAEQEYQRDLEIEAEKARRTSLAWAAMPLIDPAVAEVMLQEMGRETAASSHGGIPAGYADHLVHLRSIPFMQLVAEEEVFDLSRPRV